MPPERRQVLFVEDNPKHRALYVRRLEQEGYEVVPAATAEEALERFSDQTGAVVTDMYLPGMDGGELMARLHQMRSDIPVIILTNQGRVEDSLELIRRGAYDYVQKTQGFKDFALRVARAIQHEELNREVRRLRRELEKSQGLVASADPRMKPVLDRVSAVARTPYPVLLTGESGTGKEMFARMIHDRSLRPSGPFLTVNCGAIPRELFESELFGHLKGSFTGATEDRAGMFEEAGGGTLFLDEVADIAYEHQVKLLRVLQDGEIRRVGATRSRRVDVRVLAATNRDLAKEVEAGRFREDLYYRIQVMSISLPSLRERREDILPLAQFFLKRGMAETGKKVDGFRGDAVEALRGYAWPGNIRELANRVRQALIVCEERSIRAADLELSGGTGSVDTGRRKLEEMPLAQARREFERGYLEACLKRTGGNVTRAAEESGKHRSEFYALLKKHEIDPATFRS